jgi:hypothetical protein
VNAYEAGLNAPVQAVCLFPAERAGDTRGLTEGLRVVVEGRFHKVGHEVIHLEDCRLIRPGTRPPAAPARR